MRTDSCITRGRTTNWKGSMSPAEASELCRQMGAQSPRKPIVYIVDRELDEDGIEDEQRDLLAEFCPNLDVRFFANPGDVLNEPCPDVIIVDVGTLAGPFPQPEMALRFTETILSRFESATAFIISAVQGWADDAAAQLAPYKPLVLPGTITEWAPMLAAAGIDAGGDA